MTTPENDPQLDPTAAQNFPFSLPPYPKMIMEAIEASNDPYGCSKTAIAKHIESTKITLPPSHMTLLNFHLNQMKQSGQLMVFKNNYMKPDPNGPPKRGRGRPPKPKPEAGSSNAAAVPAPSASPSRPRGRPPKSKEAPSEPKEKAPSVSGRPRGRPPKKQKTESETVKAADAPKAKPEGERRGRGRPPKVKPAMVPVGC
ncbi:Linker histone H1/H5 domain H15 [Arabidopsis suecica]|uniref:Linker histone H1/H5 domain H15 n=1 Tax=Arabidopsis suecica TaxID=45249 RepID=A0A8T1ZT61_ARASU|nr:Linker histone H1/H5 domain H15 [Arabidopsis suecica]